MLTLLERIQLAKQQFTPANANMTSAVTGLPVVANNPKAKVPVQKKSLFQRISDFSGKFLSGGAELEKAIIRAPIRAMTSGALDFAAGVTSLATGKNVSPVYEPKTTIEKILFGAEPIKGVLQRVLEAQQKTQQMVGSRGGLGTGASLAIAPIFVAGSVGLDLSPFGGARKKLAENIVKEVTEDGMKILLKKAGVADDLIKIFTPQAVKINKLADAEKFIANIERIQKTTTVVEKVKPNILPNIKPKVIRDEAKISEIIAQKQDLQLKKEFSSFSDEETETGYQQFKTFINRFRETPEDVEALKIKLGDRVKPEEIDNLLYSQEFSVDEMYSKFLDRYSGDKKIATNLAKLQTELNAVKGKAIKNYTSEQVEKINNLMQDATFSSGKKEIPLIAKSAGEAQSPIAQADQALSKVPEILRKKVYSLPTIIAKDIKDVKKKVNVIDYLRTPDRVLNKIGLGSEAKRLQAGYNAYVKELPKNIEKITAWSKQVPKESAESIFKYLDGKEIKLTDAELKVAGEIKDWLKDWAKRLKLPEDRTITNYITHIFDKELIAKEFDEELAKIITDKVPGSVYDPFLLERLGAKGYKQNVWEALDAYVKRGTRKANIDDALKAIQDKVGSSLEESKVEVSAWKYVQKYISGVNMRPTELDNLIDNSIKNLVGYKFGQRPVTYLTKLLRQMTYRGLLGGNVSSALRNISQGVNTYAVLGEKYTAIGYTNLFKKGAMQELAEEGVLLDNFIQDRTLSSTKKFIEKFDKALFAFFQGAEKVNRGAAYFGAKSKALAQGKTMEEAISFGKETVRKTQFTFGSVDTPVALQSDIVKTVAQLQNFTIKQTEFLTEMVKDKNFVGLIRYAVGGMAFVYTIGKLFGMEPKELLPNFRFDTPPSLKLPVEIGKAVLNVPDKFGNKRDLGEKASDIGKSAIGLIPAGSQIKKTIEGAQTVQEGGSYTKSGNLQFKQGETLKEKIQSFIFGKYASQNAKDYFAGETVAEKELERLNKLPKDEANKIVNEYKQNDPSLYGKIKALKQDEVLGITDEDKKIREMGVENLERAKFILKEANKLKTIEEKNAYINDLRRKKIISDNVMKQLKQLKEKVN